MYIDTSNATDGSGRICLNAKTADFSLSAEQANKLSSTYITTSDDLDGFFEKNVFKTAVYNGVPVKNIDGHGILLSGGWNGNYGFQLAIDDDQEYKMALRQKDNSDWSDWKLLPMADGQHASGTWDIDISGKANSATKLETANCINGIQFDGSISISNYATCKTQAGTAAKVATIWNNGSFTLETGARVSVKFTYANQIANSTLNVNNTGAKTIRYRNANLQSSQYWVAGQIVDFVYDGSFWYVIGTIYDNNNTYTAVTTTNNGLMIASDKVKLDKYPDCTTNTVKFLREDGTWQEISVSAEDTKNTAGSSNTSNKIFLIGATSQTTESQTYSHDTAYVGTNGHLYSNSIQVVNLSDTQALTNKTYNGYTLGAACAKSVTDSTSASYIGKGTSLVTERDVYYGLPNINNSHTYTSSTNIYAPISGGNKGCLLVANGTTSAPTWASKNDLVFTKSGTGAAAGLVPAPSATAGTTKFLCEDSTWKEISSSSSQANYYGTCSTGASTAAKTATIDNFELKTGVQVTIFFSNENTASAPTLNINNTGAKLLTYINYSSGDSSTYSFSSIVKNNIYTFIYNGTKWVLIDKIKGVQDSTAANALGTTDNLVTERDVYYGLPTINNVHTYNSNTKIYAPTSGGISGYILKANGSTKAPTWVDPSTLLGDSSSGGSLLGTYTTATAPSSIPTGISYIELPANATSTGDPTYGTCLTVSQNSTTRAFQLGVNNSPNAYIRAMHTNNTNTTVPGYTEWYQIWRKGNSVTGAIWNDYAECRESDCEEFGYVLMETGNDSLTKTTERLSHFAGVSSDTWGFSQGETESARTPIAVAGRVLVYPYQDRNNYKPGDCVCAAPGGTVDIMTREEVKEYPDRIVGTVSCVPDYDEWGGGENADRPAVKVDNRIWIKIK